MMANGNTKEKVSLSYQNGLGKVISYMTEKSLSLLAAMGALYEAFYKDGVQV